MAAQEIKISNPSRIVKQQAEATIQHLIDAVVELTTNCDDSYKRLEDAGEKPSGRIGLYVSREKGGRCSEFKIEDYAEGMDKKKLEEAIAYGGESSGFIEGKSVRGLLGRGLKESILGLGEGKIYTNKDGLTNCVKIWWDGKERKALWEFVKNEDFDKKDEDINKFISSGENGIFIKIIGDNEKIKISEGENFITQIADHYALRDINSSKHRKVILNFEDLRLRLKNSTAIEFIPPEGELRCDKSIPLPRYKDLLELKVWESKNPLNFQRYEPWSSAGILIKTENAILDNQLFKFDNDPAAFYFWGEASCKGIALKIRKAAARGAESEIIDLSRKGLNWRSDYCKAIREVIEKELFPLVQKKKKELESGEKKETSQGAKRVLNNICKLLDSLARKEIKEWEAPLSKNFQELTIVPDYVNIEINNPRALSIYAPKGLVREMGSKVTATSDNGDIRIMFPGTKRLGLSWNIDLNKHPDNPNVWYAFFKIVGREMDKEALISCKLGNQKAEAIVKVVAESMKEGGSRKKKRKRGGFISSIVSDIYPDPSQRVEYEENFGKMKVYVKFPGIGRYLTSSLKEVESREDSKAILAELVGEAFCKILARKKLETKGTFGGLEGQIDEFNNEVNRMQKKYLGKIHDIVLNWKP